MEDHDSSEDSGDSTSLSPERTQYIEYCRVVMSSIERLNYHVRDRRPCMTSNQTGAKWISELLEGHPDRIHDAFRMSKRIFTDLLHKLEVDHELQGSRRTFSREILGITLYILAQRGSFRLTKERFQHSTETISRYFSKGIRSLLLLSIDVIKPIDRQFRDIPAEIRYDSRYMQFFKDCVGVIDGTHVDARIPVEDQV
ncbi:hypothetical protein KSP39_PZI001552 [Platanthera zijinensis]|uniref:DUF8040 domain-containing protein n=1 Tax=Platanthera zijinensis TaxID=2320716 RepID=A0AAP0C2U8_9ASPA